MEPRIERLLHALRLFGAAMVATAAGTFLVQSWDAVGDVTRYLALLAMTVALPFVAYVCGVRFREDRSARVLLITLLALIPVHAGVLAGFFFSQFGTPNPGGHAAAQWIAPSPLAAILLVLGAGVVLVPLAWSAYRALDREHARLLTTVSASLHALLLVPSRSALVATILVGPMVAGASWCATRVAPKTREAKIAVASLFAPLALLLSRQVLFYDASGAFWGMVLGMLAAGLFVLGQRTRDDTLKRFSVVPMLLSAGCFWMAVAAPDRWGAALTGLSYGWLAALPLGAAAWASPSLRGFFLGVLGCVNALVAFVVLLVDASPWAAFESIALGLAFASYGYLRKRPIALYVGAGLLVPGVIVELNEAIERFEPGGWLALALFGIALVGLTAWLERRPRPLPRTEAE